MALKKNCSTCLHAEPSDIEDKIFCTADLSPHFEENDVEPETWCYCYEEG